MMNREVVKYGDIVFSVAPMGSRWSITHQAPKGFRLDRVRMRRLADACGLRGQSRYAAYCMLWCGWIAHEISPILVERETGGEEERPGEGRGEGDPLLIEKNISHYTSPISPLCVVKISSDASFYAGRTPGYRATKRARDTLVDLGFITHTPGYHDRGKYGGQGSFRGYYHLTPEGYDLASELVVPVKSLRVHSSAECRRRDKSLVDWTVMAGAHAVHQRIALTKQLAEMWKQYRLIARCSPRIIDLEQDNYLGNSDITSTVTSYKWIYSRGSLDAGGRVYCPAQNLPSGQRKNLITGNREPLVELDYSAHHIRLLYEHPDFLGGTLVDIDPYDFAGGHRPLNKLMLLIAINAKSKKQTLASLRRNHAEQIPPGLDISKQYDHILRHNAPIAQWISSDIGIALQKIDSEITEHIIRACVDAGIPIIPIHDGYMVPTSQRDYLWKAMEEIYRAVTGGKAHITIIKR